MDTRSTAWLIADNQPRRVIYLPAFFRLSRLLVGRFAWNQYAMHRV